MKKTLLLLFIATLFTGCKKDAPITPVPIDNTQSFTYTYELDGVPVVCVVNSSTIIFNQMSLGGFNNSDISIATVVMLYVDSPSLQTYSLPENISDSNSTSLFTSSYISIGTPKQPTGHDYFYTSMNGSQGNNNAQITITELDYTNKVASGTFNGRVALSSDTTNIHEVTNGVFTDLPFQ